MKIALDMMGGDYAPDQAAAGVRAYLDQTITPSEVLLIGAPEQLEPLFEKYQIPRSLCPIVAASQVIGMHEHPTKALKEKPDSSISVGFRQLATGHADAFISAGNTGSMLVGALFSIKAIEGVQRPTIATIIPRENGKAGLLLDVGLNADCKPEVLNQFAVLGTLYARHILGIPEPRVGLVNIGEEEGKGNLLAQGTYPLLKANAQIHFLGNVEGRDIFLDKADVMVCDGFTGNIILKLAESLFEITQRQQIHHPYFDRFNFENYGGTPVLGVSKPVVIGHGISGARSFCNMIVLAEKMVQSDLLGKMKTSFQMA